ncbi:MAG: hypothetical protein CMK70_14520 [Pseudohongiella sp.]|nr:hypothetical protein [Pseudohongiella sp.]
MEMVFEYFTPNDIFTFASLAIIGAIGAFVKFIIVNYEFDKKAHEVSKPKYKSFDAGGAQILARILIGSIAAMLLGLAIVDAIIPERGPFFKLLLLGFIAGYIAPEFFRSQEKRMLKYLASQLPLTQETNEKRQSSTGEQDA